MNPINLNNNNKIDRSDKSESNPVNLNSFSQLNSVLNKETSFIQESTLLLNNRKSPSVLLKHSVSSRTSLQNELINNENLKLNLKNDLINFHNFKNLQKSKSAPFLGLDQQQTNLNENNSLINSSNLFSNNNNNNQNVSKLLTSTPNLFNYSSSNLFNSNNYNNSYNNNLNLIETPNLKSNQESKGSNSYSNGRAKAIYMKNVSYDFKNSKLGTTNVLRNVNLNCDKGTIYGLLGPSGCGKTTLLKLILNKFKPIAGEIRAFGYPVESKYSGMVGPGVGYMPQELALVFDLTIEEHLIYFGRLYYMPYEPLHRKINYLCNILDLPEKTRFIHQLSGGQQHRVSFACSLIHDPRLLILDEPTVGLDPILRERIWLQLISLAENEGTTILITTHYIEEAKRANTIGFIRKGQLLVEQSPQFLIKKYETNSLERIFYKICIEQVGQKKEKKAINHIDVNFNNSVNEMIEESLRMNDDNSNSPCSSKSTDSTADINDFNLNYTKSNDNLDEYINREEDEILEPWFDRYSRSSVSKWLIQFFIVIWKYFILIRRRPETVLAQYVLPIIAIAVFCVCIGSTPTGINLAIINEEDCGYPIDLFNQIPSNVPDSEHIFSNFTEKLRNLFKIKEYDENENENVNRIKFNKKRSIDDELSTLNLNILNEEEVTTYPNKFNLMNNLNFNENKFGKLNELNTNENSIDKLLKTKEEDKKFDILTTTEKIKSNNNTRIEETETELPIILVNSNNNHLDDEEDEKPQPPVLMPVLSELSNVSNVHNELNNNNDTNEKLPTRIDNDEDDDVEEGDETRLVNPQFENACFSHILIKKLNTFIFNRIPYTSHEKAIEDIRTGKIWGVIRIRKGFSRAIFSKIMFQDYGDTNISNSILEINADLTNRALVITLEVTLNRLYDEFIQSILIKANEINKRINQENNNTELPTYNLKSGRLPIILAQHVFKPKFTLSDYFGVREFCAPGLFIILSYSISYALTVFSLVNEIGDKMFDRHQSIGLSSNQLIFSHLFTRFIFSASGIILIFFISLYFFDIANHGSALNAVTLLLLQSYCAMIHGMLISVLCPSLFICAAISNGYLFFIFIISGVLWSFETLPPLMKSIGMFLPPTIPCESIRSIMTRGLGFESDTVKLGYVVTISWIIIHYVLTIIVFNYRKNNK